MLIDAQGSVTFATDAAEHAFGRIGVLAAINGELVALGSPSNAHMLRAVLAAATDGRSASVVLVDACGRAAYTLTAVALPERLRDELAVMRPRAVLLLRTIERDMADAVAIMGDAFRLTGAERRVLSCLLEADSPGEMAARLHLSMNTIRTQMKSIFAKTCTGSQRELLVLASRFRF